MLGEILKHTPADHSDCDLIRKVMDIITGFLRRLNNESGNAKNKFDLLQLHNNMSFKSKADEMVRTWKNQRMLNYRIVTELTLTGVQDLDLLAEDRLIIKQGPLKKTAALDSSDYQLILLDNYLLITKLKVVGFEEHYTIQRKVSPKALVTHVCHLSSYLFIYSPSQSLWRCLLLVSQSKLELGGPVLFCRMLDQDPISTMSIW